jgi:MSHA biogenesis protein MshG
MPEQYSYKAVSPDGVRKRGAISATSPSQVEEFLRERNLIPVKIQVVKERKPLSLFGFLRGREYENLILFTSSLSTMYRAGIPLLQALSIIRIGNPGSRFNQIIERIRTRVESGKPLSEAMAEYDDIFSRVYTASVAAGEESGRLDETLDELAEMMERELDLNRRIISAIRYPAIVVALILVAFFVLMGFVIPRFVAFYSAFDAELPVPTRIIIAISTFMTTYWPYLLVITVTFILGFRYMLNDPRGRLWHDRRLLKIPVLGDLAVKGTVARFCLMFRILFKAGLPLVQSMDILSATVRNQALAAEVNLLQDLFRKGKDINILNGSFYFFPEQALHMISIGLESGNLERMLKEVGDHYSRRVLYISRHLTAIIEPILTVALGIFVLILALAIFLPMWNLIKVFKG